MIRQLDKRIEIGVRPTIWGFGPTQLHDRFWASRGVQVVRQGEVEELSNRAELFLLTDAKSLVIFRLGRLVDTLSWLKPTLLVARLRNTQEQGYREHVVMDDDGRFIRFERVYDSSDTRISRAALTLNPKLARLWQQPARCPSVAWLRLRHAVQPINRLTLSINGSVYDRTFDPEVMQFVRRLIQVWRCPDATIRRARRLNREVWADHDTPIDSKTGFVGTVWLGTGRKLDGLNRVVGPAVLWDKTEARPKIDSLRWEEIERVTHAIELPIQMSQIEKVDQVGKRGFDIVFSFLALLGTIWIYPIAASLIWLTDGRPIFFIHRRQTVGGRNFPCIKFRTMKENADRMTSGLGLRNRADGPQVYIDPDEDPRLTRVGRWMRRFDIDEVPQFLNVLLGHMSIVGPRPSPDDENQFSPSWRETRLSLRPGITGLWQVMRSRKEGLDFQEWIRYDIMYAETKRWRLDLWLIWRTVLKLIGIKTQSLPSWMDVKQI